MRNWAIISVMSRDHGFGKRQAGKFSENTYNVVRFCDSEKEAKEMFEYSQGQSFESGEVHRFLVEVKASK